MLLTGLCLLLVMLIPAQALSASVRFGIMGQPPYGFWSGNGEARGYLYDIADAILARAELPGDNRVLPHKRLLSALESGERNCSLFAGTPEVRKRFRLVEPLGCTLQAGILPAAGIDLKRYEDLSNLSIAVSRGVSFNTRFDNDSALNKVVTKNYYLDAVMLKRGRVDAVAGAISSHLFNLRKLGWSVADVGTPLVFSELPLWLACRPDDPAPESVRRLQDAVRGLREDGTVVRTIERYMGRPLAER